MKASTAEEPTPDGARAMVLACPASPPKLARRENCEPSAPSPAELLPVLEASRLNPSSGFDAAPRLARLAAVVALVSLATLSIRPS